MNLTEIVALLVEMALQAEKSVEMAAQLDKRARQLTERTGKTREQAIAHLLGLMTQGWAAKEKGL